MNIVRPFVTAVTAASLAISGCASAPGEAGEQTGSAQEAALTFNALTFNALTFNALTFNALTFNALTFNALTFNALTFNALTFNQLTMQALEDPNARETLSYVVSCALTPEESFSLNIQGQTYQFNGELGLAPEWGEKGGFCDDNCQQWVSACVISRLDYLGVPTEISVRGQDPALATSAAERASYPAIEATYYGDIFTSPMKLYACLPPGKTEIPRVCGPSIKGCGVDVVGECTQLCGPESKQDGSFPNCSVPSAGKPGCEGNDTYHGSITVFLP